MWRSKNNHRGEKKSKRRKAPKKTWVVKGAGQRCNSGEKEPTKQEKKKNTFPLKKKKCRKNRKEKKDRGGVGAASFW